MNKTALRKQCLLARKAITPTMRAQAESQIMAHLRDMLAEKHGVIALYMPIQEEVNPLCLASSLLPDAEYAMPCLMGEKMWFARWHLGMKMQAGDFGILQPVDAVPVVPEVVITPVVGFDAAGHRLGYGKGYYDRYFSATEQEGRIQQRIGIAFACQQVEAIPVDTHDIRLDVIITEQG